jgi:hypothetical protein
MVDENKGAATLAASSADASKRDAPRKMRVVAIATIYHEPGKYVTRGDVIELPQDEALRLLALRHVRLPDEPPPPTALITGADAAPIQRIEPLS